MEPRPLHPDETLTARAALLRQDVKDALFFANRCWSRMYDRLALHECLALTDEDRNNLADAVDALIRLNEALHAKNHPTAQGDA